MAVQEAKLIQAEFSDGLCLVTRMSKIEEAD